MALNTFSALKTAVASLLGRTDLTTQIPDFITLAEAQMNRRLRTRRQVSRSVATIASEFVAVPADFGGPRTMVISGSPNVTLDFVNIEQADALEASLYVDNGKPKIYTLVGEEFQFLPRPDDSYTAILTYWKRIPVLSDSNTSNWLLADHPDAYLYGAALQSAPYLKNDERLAVWGDLFQTILADINGEDMYSAHGRLNQMPSARFG